MLMAPAVVLQFFFYCPPSFDQLHGNARTRMQEVKRVDWVGIFLMVAGLLLFLLGISWGMCRSQSEFLANSHKAAHHCRGRLLEFLA